MSNITVKFIGQEYTIPEDILTYIDLLNFTDNIQKRLSNAFVRKLKSEINSGNVACLDDKVMASDIEQQVGKFIAKLTEHGIYDRTINDYLRENEGYKLISKVNAAALDEAKRVFKQQISDWIEGYEDAIQKKDASVTGLSFSILSGSFVNHAIYAAMEASKVNEQEKTAAKEYQKDMAELDARLASRKNEDEKRYIANTYIPHMEAAISVFSYELLDTFISDLIKYGKLNKDLLNYVHIDRSNDLLKNLELSQNKEAVLLKAFEACPYNIAVYMQAMKYDLLDYDTFQTAKVFKQADIILSFFEENWGEVSFPTKFNIHYHCVNVWASFTDKSSAELLRGLTEQYAAGIVRVYSRVADILADKSDCRKIIGGFREDVILSGDSICERKAREYVKSIAPMTIWEQLTEKCGHVDLFYRVKKCFPSAEELRTKEELDGYVIEQLTVEFENARKELVEEIKAKYAEEERQRIEREREITEQNRIQAEKKAQITSAIKQGVKRALIIIGVIVVACIALIIAAIIFLFVTDKPIDNDFAQNYKENLHGLTYCVPENWVYSEDESNDNEMWYTRYNNWGSFLGAMVVTYEGESPHVTVDSVVAEFKDECSTAKSRTEIINGQEFSIVTFTLESDDATPFRYNIYVAEEDYSVFYISFIFVEESNKTDVFDEIVGTIAFDDYVNPKEETYNDAVQLMSNGKYDQALAIFEKLSDYKDSSALIQECNAVILENKYNNAVQLMNNGELEEAITAFESIIDYKDSSAIISECKNQINENEYNQAVALANNGYYEEAIMIFDSLGNYRDVSELSQKYTRLICEVGDIITFGHYEQDNNPDNGAETIEWIVLERDGNQVFVISKYCLDSLAYNETFVHITWKNSTIREWLNHIFYSSAFSEAEQAMIIPIEIMNPDDFEETNTHGSTMDLIFLLSLNEADRYFESDSDRKTEGTEYAWAQGNPSSWWLRSSGNKEYVAYVGRGEIGFYEEIDRVMGIRPAMWIEISE